MLEKYRQTVGESLESVLEKNRKDLQKRKVLRLE